MSHLASIRGLLRPGEQLLWATHTNIVQYHVRGLQRDGSPQPGFGVRIGTALINGVGEVLAATEDGGGRPDQPDLVAFGTSPESIAVGIARLATGWRPWALTTTRLLLADIVREAPPEEPKRSFLGEIVQLGRELAAPKDKGFGKRRQLDELRETASVPRGQIVNISLTGKPTFLRVELADKSGFDFTLGGKVKRAHFERMLALSQGAPE
ncbi:MAG TPA: hypothetical protein VM677_34060 [Actinokineospora sp.]|nr:hypothetical protein [Actinokineospora sp.]